MLDEELGMMELDQIGTRAGLTCPECGGAIWEIQHSHPLRYRCHTGHAFTAKVLAGLQSAEVEEAMWAAVRALHEQEQLFRKLHLQAQGSGTRTPGRTDSAQEYLIKAEQSRDHAQKLRDLIAMRLHIVAA
jgi:two-component system chemotaxis response regulator CheB